MKMVLSGKHQWAGLLPCAAHLITHKGVSQVLKDIIQTETVPPYTKNDREGKK
jgi:hypothetical protein